MDEVTHAAIWQGIERLAKAHDYSPSGLAKKAGLDPTIFNKSKRTARNGRLHWPSTESISRILEVVGVSWSGFGQFLGNRDPVLRVPVIGLVEAGSDGYFDDAGHPTGGGWDFIDFPWSEGSLYALEISGESMEPVYKAGDTVIVSADRQPRRDDRVVVKTSENEVMLKILARKTAERVVLESFNPKFAAKEVPMVKVSWIHTVIWSSQSY